MAGEFRFFSCLLLCAERGESGEYRNLSVNATATAPACARPRHARQDPMAQRLKPLQQLQGAQEHASRPGGHAALSASAGTGKTHVLTARVLRLLLSGADPSSILCLTFTKAGAAEMAGRIHAPLPPRGRPQPREAAAGVAAPPP